MILGLDVSTSVIGVCVIDDDNIVETTYWDLRKIEGLYEKATVVEDKIKALREVHQISAVYIEEALQMFGAGLSSATTIATLQKFNGIVSWLCYQLFGARPTHLNPTSARSFCGIKVPRGQKAKEVVYHHWTVDVPVLTPEYGRTGKPKPHMYDIADAITIAKAGRLVTRSQKSGDSE